MNFFDEPWDEPSFRTSRRRLIFFSSSGAVRNLRTLKLTEFSQLQSPEISHSAAVSKNFIRPKWLHSKWRFNDGWMLIMTACCRQPKKFIF